MGVTFNEVNFDLLLSDLSESCTNCGECKKKECIIGYAKECVKDCLKNNVTYVMNGCNNIPLHDSKIFETEYLAKSIANILKQCKSCKEEHYDNCLINVMRSCYEVCIFGEIQKYEGSTFNYLNKIQNLNPDIADEIIQFFNKNKEAI